MGGARRHDEGSGPQRLSLAPRVVKGRSLGLLYYLKLFIRLRWFAGLGALAAVLVSEHALGIRFPYPALYGAILAIGAANLLFFLFAHFRAPPDDPGFRPDERARRVNHRFALVQINFDFAALTALLHLSGGLENPCVLFFVFHVVISGILLEPRWALTETALASALLFALGVGEKTGVLAHHHPHEILPSALLTDNWYLALGLPAVLTLTMGILAGVTIAIMSEFTRRRNQVIALSRTLEAQNRKLTRIDELRRGLMAVASHDLKAPVAAVASYLMALEDGYLGEISERQREVVRKCLVRLDGLGAFIADILDVQSIEAGDLRRDFAPLDLSALIARSVENFADGASAAGVTLERAGEMGPLEIEGAAGRLGQLLDNLVGNAVKYTPAGGRVKITAAGERDGVRIEVADTGIGIAPEDVERLFEDFFRAPSVRGRFEGTGLGLSVVARIVRAHRGEVTVDSTPGEGSTFTVTLPRRPPADGAPPTPTSGND